MPEDKNSPVPATEPPPHPGGVSEGGRQYSIPQQQVDQSLYEAVETPVVSQEQEQSIPLPQVETQPPPPPKRGFPKLIFIGAFLFLLLAIVAYLTLRARQSGVSLFGKEGEIVWWGIQHEQGVYASLISEFETQNPDIKVRYERQSRQDYRERLTNALAQGSGPDIFEIHNSWPAMFAGELSPLPSSVMSAEEFNNSFYPIIVSDLTSDKGIIAMPLEYDALTLFINEDIFASAAKRPPESWDDVRNLASELTQRGEEGVIIQAGAGLGFTQNIDHWPEIIGLMMYQNRVNPGAPLGELAQDVFSFYSLFKQNGVWDERLPRTTLAFSTGKLAMYFGPSRRASEIVSVSPNLRFRTVILPQIPKNLSSDPNFSYTTYWVQGVWQRSKNKQIAWEFLKFMSSREALEEINRNMASLETFARVYPRAEMNISLREDSVLGSVVHLAPEAKSWYLADNTNDGPTGINTQINQLYQKAVEAGGSIGLDELSSGIAGVLNKYGISR